MYAIQSSAGRCTNHKEKPRSFTDHELFIEEELEIEEDLPPGPVHSLWLLKVVLACALHDSNSLFAFPYAIFIPRIYQSSPLDLFVLYCWLHNHEDSFVCWCMYACVHA